MDKQSKIIPTEYNVVLLDTNGLGHYYDVFPYLLECWKELRKKDKPKTFEEFKSFITRESLYQFWSRCQYETIISDWPCQKLELKIDVHEQIMSNIDIVTNAFMEYISTLPKNK